MRESLNQLDALRQGIIFDETFNLPNAQKALQDCLSGKSGQSSPNPSLSQLAGTSTSASGAPGTVPPSQQSTTFGFCGVTSIDPNAKLGTSGAGDAQYVRDGVPLSYTILFENLPTAAAAASRVVVTDALDAGLDPATLSINDIRFGDTTSSCRKEWRTTQRALI